MPDSKYSFSDYRNVRKYYDHSFMTKHDKLHSFYHPLNQFSNLVPRTEETKNKKRECLKML